MKKVSRADLARAVSIQTGHQINTCGMVFNALLDELTDRLSRGLVVELRGAGMTLYSPRRKARLGRNPRTGAEVWIPEQFTARVRFAPDYMERR